MVFEQQNESLIIGKTFNKAYTMLLASRIFGLKQNSRDKYLIKMVEQIEDTFKNKKEMEALYFNHDLPSLIKHLEKYLPREKVICFLLDIDLYYLNRSILNPVCLIDKRKIKKQLEKIKR